ncbi:exosortase C-terminal domain/associated protein EpsI [Desulforapulum autotrophicum]|nr:exosortase C-terminal domain/associated protein EpsI [Desulforapulum autotrophicum]
MIFKKGGTCSLRVAASSNKPFDTFPMTIGPWTGTTSTFDQKVYDILGVEDSILASYETPDGRDVQLYVGFYQSQKEGDLIHSPKNCMPGSGWNILRSSIEPVDVGQNNNGKNINVIKLILVKDSQKQVVLYWFQSRGRIISSEYMQKIWLVIDSITKHRTDGSFVRLISPVVENEDKTLEILKDFTKQIYPYLNEYIPS